MKIAVINGPNLNRLGKRETKIYGSQRWENIWEMLEIWAKVNKISLQYFQSNSEGALIDHLQKCDTIVDGVIFNPGAYAHTSIAIRDCVAILSRPVVEVHISKLIKRESFRHKSFLSDVVFATISGFGSKGYPLAIQMLAKCLKI